MSTAAAEPPSPFVVAHRAGNDLGRLRAAEALRVPLIEADVHLFAGRLEVRHLKTLGPVPLLWDRWELAPPWTPRLRLEDLLAARAPGTELMLDLKGHDRHIPSRIAEAVLAAPGRLTVCSQDWRLLAPLRELDGIRLVHSIGNTRQLSRLGRAGPLAGVSIHHRLLDRNLVHELRRRAQLVMTWPVESVDQARVLGAWGVQGLISQNFERLAPALEAAA